MNRGRPPRLAAVAVVLGGLACVAWSSAAGAADATDTTAPTAEVTTSGTPMKLPAWSPPSVLQQGEITPPELWAGADSDGDGRLSVAEADAMSEDDFEALREWVSTTLDEVDDNDFRAWADEHIGNYDEDDLFDVGRLRNALGIPAPGYGDEVREIPGEATEAAGDVAEPVVSEVSNSAFDAVAERVAEAAADLTGSLGEEMARTGRPDLNAPWYQVHYQRMLGWSGILLLPLAFLAIGSSVVRGDTAQLGQTLLQVPIVYLLGILAISAVSAASGLATAMARSLVPDIQVSAQQMADRVRELAERDAVPGDMGMGMLFIVGLFIAVSALVTILWLLLAEAAIYATVLFIPLAFAGRVWEPARDWGRKLLTITFALVAAKVVVFAVWAVAVDGLGTSFEGETSTRTALALAALLLMTGLSPSAALRFAPMLEGGASIAGSPGQSARTALSAGYYGGGVLRMTGLSGGRGGRGGGGRGLGVGGNVAGATPRGPAGGDPSSRSGSPGGPSTPQPPPAPRPSPDGNNRGAPPGEPGAGDGPARAPGAGRPARPTGRRGAATVVQSRSSSRTRVRGTAAASSGPEGWRRTGSGLWRPPDRPRVPPPAPRRGSRG